MKNIADTKSHSDMRKAVVVAYVSSKGFIFRNLTKAIEVTIKRRRIYERA